MLVVRVRVNARGRISCRSGVYIGHYSFKDVIIIPAKAFARIMESPAYVCLSVCLSVCLLPR